MGKKKFIQKGEGQHFYLLHRSQTDEAYAKEERPSDFVLVPANVNGNVARKLRAEEETQLNGGIPLRKFRDHITPLGFKNDGYDYTKHLKEMGGGRFIGKDGSVRDLSYDYSKGPELELPEDVLPSGMELERNLEAVTISHEYMDDDLKAALFEGADEEGEFEELQDDFVVQVMNAPEEADFDFDAHIAELIAKSERSTQAYAAPRGWDNDKKLLATGRFGKKRSDNEEDLPDIAEGEEYDYEEDEEEGDEDEFDEYDEYDEEDGACAVWKGGKRMSAEQEALFEKTLEEYDDGQLGYMEEADEEALQGVIDFEGDDLFELALEEYLQEQKDNILAEGITVKKGLRSIEQLEDPSLVSITKEEALKPENVKRLYDGEKMRQLESQIEVEEIEKGGGRDDDALLTCQEYLREERPEEKWDCETILSTYSTLDNHPTLIKDGNSKFKPYKNKYTKSVEAAQAALSATGSVAGSVSAAVPGGISQLSKGREGVQQLTSSGTAAKILLTGRHGLPEGFGPERRGGGGRNNVSSSASVSLTANSLSMLALNNNTTTIRSTARIVTLPKEGKDKRKEQDGGDDVRDDGNINDLNDNDDDDDDSEDEDYEEGLTVSTTASVMRMKGETPEQRKARKAAVKEEKRAKRAVKKQLKNAYKEEDKKQVTALGRQQSINNASVFKYTV